MNNSVSCKRLCFIIYEHQNFELYYIFKKKLLVILPTSILRKPHLHILMLYDVLCTKQFNVTWVKKKK